MIDFSKIAVLTTVINWELYRKSVPFFPSNIKRYVIDGRNGMHGLDSLFYMMKKFKHINVDWLIMADEDVLFLDQESVFETIQYLQANDYILCGVRDGGQIGIRTYNPYVINTFFSIINLKKLKSIWNEKEVKKNQFIIENEFNDELENVKFDFDKVSLYEPYYCFYFWLRRKGEKILFLDAQAPFEDNITTLVYGSNKSRMLYHTWYARSYGSNIKHTERIDEVFKLLEIKTAIYSEPVIWKNKWFPFLKYMRKQKRRISNKIDKISSNWGV